MPETEQAAERGHFTMKAVVQPITDEGVFEAVISTASIDREKDIVEPGALVAALKRWNRPVPLAWEHSTNAEDIVGSVEPMTAREVDREVVVQGQVDLESKQGAAAWPSFKAGSLGFSYGYLVPEGGSKAREGGGKHITVLDVFEITVTRAPMNNDTRVLAVKAMEDRVDTLERRIKDLEGSIEALEPAAAAASTVDPLEEATRQAVRDVRLDGIPERKSPEKPVPTPGPPTEADLRDEFRAVMMRQIRET